MTYRTDDASAADDSLSQLSTALAGEVIGPTDPAYDGARVCFNALVDRRPAAIARCLGPEDITTAFDFARTHELEVAVRGGGHNPAGHCMVDGGLVIDLSLLRTVEVDQHARTAEAEGGSTWLDFDSATQVFGLVAPGGVVGSTGVCGLTLGGGIGHLTAQYGLTCDNLVGAELVSADGSVIRAGSEWTKGGRQHHQKARDANDRLALTTYRATCEPSRNGPKRRRSCFGSVSF